MIELHLITMPPQGTLQVLPTLQMEHASWQEGIASMFASMRYHNRSY